MATIKTKFDLGQKAYYFDRMQIFSGVIGAMDIDVLPEYENRTGGIKKSIQTKNIAGVKTCISYCINGLYITEDELYASEDALKKDLKGRLL